jgi:hypothetical protein
MFAVKYLVLFLFSLVVPTTFAFGADRGAISCHIDSSWLVVQPHSVIMWGGQPDAPIPLRHLQQDISSDRSGTAEVPLYSSSDRVTLDPDKKYKVLLLGSTDEGHECMSVEAFLMKKDAWGKSIPIGENYASTCAGSVDTAQLDFLFLDFRLYDVEYSQARLKYGLPLKGEPIVNGIRSEDAIRMVKEGFLPSTFLTEIRINCQLPKKPKK